MSHTGQNPGPCEGTFLVHHLYNKGIKMKLTMEHMDRLRASILENLEDLREKIMNNEDLPEGEQDLNLLIGIDELVEECLHNWYY
jgi:hypothetical protein